MTIDLLFERTGQAVALLYFGYGLLLAAGVVLAFHALVLLLLVVATRREVPRFPRLVLLAELLYGFANPLLYLVILQPAVVPGYGFLTAVAWGLFLLVWGSRTWGGFDRVRGSAMTRRFVQGLLLLSFLCIAAFLVKDILPFAVWEGSISLDDPWRQLLWGLAMLASLGALYMIPVVLILRHLRLTREDEPWANGRWFFRVSKAAALTTGALLLAGLGVSSYRPSTATVERLVLRHRAEIIDASERLMIDPRLTASILYVTQRDLSTPFARQLERAAMAAWLADLTNNYFLAKPLDVSVGLTQIKPFTALAALVIYMAPALPPPSQVHYDLAWEAVSGLSHPVNYKEYRGIPRLGERWRLPAKPIHALRPVHRSLVPKARIVEDLFDDRLNIDLCALILSLYAIQWEAADPAWSIRQRPEILATLYQLGFEKSWPKANPQPNAFGERVRQVYESPWMREHFGPK
jgi:hypothetical protein